MALLPQGDVVGEGLREEAGHLSGVGRAGRNEKRRRVVHELPVPIDLTGGRNQPQQRPDQSALTGPDLPGYDREAALLDVEVDVLDPFLAIRKPVREPAHPQMLEGLALRNRVLDLRVIARSAGTRVRSSSASKGASTARAWIRSKATPVRRCWAMMSPTKAM